MDSQIGDIRVGKQYLLKVIFNNTVKAYLLLKIIDSCYQKLRPVEHEIQRKEALKSNYHIDNTAFSTITVNANFQTGLHKDSGDFTGGFGNLVITEKGEYQGGYTLFPQFGVGFDCRMRDFLAMDVHQWHCNTPLEIRVVIVSVCLLSVIYETECTSVPC